MSGMAEITQRFARITEISGVMTAMKNLSLVETRKLVRFVEHQRQMLANIEAAATDFLHFFPIAVGSSAQRILILLVGSERGFCGNFNARMQAALHELPAWEAQPELLVVGSRLGARLEAQLDAGSASEKRTSFIDILDGPTVAEDVPIVLGRMMSALHGACLPSAADLQVYGLAHAVDDKPCLRLLLPLPATSVASFTYAPRIQLPAPEFLSGLLDQYLLAALYGLLYDSLAVENRQRLAHMENALDRLSEMLNGLALKRNALRQEKIIEEIEVILSSEQAFSTR